MQKLSLNKDRIRPRLEVRVKGCLFVVNFVDNGDDRAGRLMIPHLWR